MASGAASPPEARAGRAVKVRPRANRARGMPTSKEPNPATLVAEAQLKVSADNPAAALASRVLRVPKQSKHPEASWIAADGAVDQAWRG